jgi:predicted dehydrogenase
LIRVGIVGTNYGRQVLLPAFRLDPRCEVVALAGSDPARAGALAQESGIANGYGDWRALIDSAEVDAVAIAVPPRLQPEVAVRALQAGKPVFVEKPMAADLGSAADMVRAAGAMPAMIDFTFTQLPAWAKAKAMLDAGAIGRLRHIAVTWQVENASTRLRLKNWKTDGSDGGGALGNLASHSMHTLEWFCGPLAGLSARLTGLPDDPAFETGVTMALSFGCGATGSFALSCAAYRGSGHRLEFYGEDGHLILANATADYMRGFTLHHARRPDAPVAVAVEDDPRDSHFPNEARIAPVSRLVARFLDAIEGKAAAEPNLLAGYRAQALLDAVRRSHDSGRWLNIEFVKEQDS